MSASRREILVVRLGTMSNSHNVNPALHEQYPSHSSEASEKRKQTIGSGNRR